MRLCCPYMVVALKHFACCKVEKGAGEAAAAVEAVEAAEALAEAGEAEPEDGWRGCCSGCRGCGCSWRAAAEAEAGGTMEKLRLRVERLWFCS